MSQLVLNIPDNKLNFFLEVIKNFRFVKIVKQAQTVETDDYIEPTKEEILANIKQGLLEVKLIEQGKMKAKPLKEFLNEL